MKSSTPTLMKFLKLQRRLNETKRGVIGLLEGMWLEVAKNCPEGDIGRFSDEEIAIMLDWEKEPEELVQALVDCRWLDRCDAHRLVVHDWAEHCPTYVRGNLRSHGKDFATASQQPAKQPAKQPANSDLQPTESQPAIADCPEDPPSKPNQVKSSLTKPSGREVAKQLASGIDQIVTHYQAHHPASRPGDKERKKIADRLAEGYTVADLEAAIEGNHKSPFHCGVNPENKKWHGINVIFRDSAQVQAFIEMASGDAVRRGPAMPTLEEVNEAYGVGQID